MGVEAAVLAVAPIAIPVILVAGLFALRAGSEYVLRTDFDSEDWRRAGSDSPMGPVRMRMVDDLLRSYDLRQMTCASVTELLGEADQEVAYSVGWDVAYFLGPERGLISMDSEWLVLRFDESDRVVAHDIVNG